MDEHNDNDNDQPENSNRTSAVTDGPNASAHHSNLQNVLSCVPYAKMASTSVRLLEVCADTDVDDSELVKERAKWIVAAVYVVAQVVPDFYTDGGAFSDALIRCEKVVQAAIRLEYN